MPCKDELVGKYISGYTGAAGGKGKGASYANAKRATTRPRKPLKSALKRRARVRSGGAMARSRKAALKGALEEVAGVRSGGGGGGAGHRPSEGALSSGAVIDAVPCAGPCAEIADESGHSVSPAEEVIPEEHDPVLEALDLDRLLQQVFQHMGIRTYADILQNFPSQDRQYNAADLLVPVRLLDQHNIAQHLCHTIFQRTVFTTRLGEFCAHFGLDATVYTQ